MPIDQKDNGGLLYVGILIIYTMFRLIPNSLEAEVTLGSEVLSIWYTLGCIATQ